MATTSQSTVEGQILAFLTGTEHFTTAGAAAALGNFDVESSFNPKAPNYKEGAIGIAQWEGGRRTALQAYAAAHGGKETDLKMQLGYLGHELAGPYRAVAAHMRTATNVDNAAQDWQANFEGSTPDSLPQRQADAQTIYQQITTGHLNASTVPLGISTSGTTAATGIAGGALGDLLGLSGITGEIGTLVMKAVFVIGGIALVVLGADQAAKGKG